MENWEVDVHFPNEELDDYTSLNTITQENGRVIEYVETIGSTTTTYTYTYNDEGVLLTESISASGVAFTSTFQYGCN